jgi:hypothetical protein
MMYANGLIKRLNFRIFVPAAILGVFLMGSTAMADNVVQGYKSKGDVETGFLVALVKDNPDTVEAVPAGAASRIFGVVVDPSGAPLTLNRQVQGPVFVSTERGAIRQGDYLSISSTAGIAANVTGSQSSIIGQALENFDGKKNAITKVGNAQVGKILVNIDPRKNPIATNDVFVPGFLKTVGQAIAGKPVSAQRIYLSLIFLIAAVALATVLLWASVRGGMIAMGRNPLNRGHILNSMFKVVSAAVMVFLIGLFGVYLLLRI